MVAASISRTKVAIVSFCFFCCALFLTAYTAKRPEVARVAYWAVGEIYHPFQTVCEAVYSRIGDLWYSYINLIGVREQNEQLTERLRELESEIVNLHEVQSENIRISKILGFVTETNVEGVLARVTGFSPSNWIKTVTINKGTADGVEINLAVVEGSGVVGQVIEVSPHSAKVLLVLDATSGVDALVQENRSRGVVSGGNRNRYIFKYVAHDQEVKVGDRIVTSGVGGIYPNGLLLGVVSEAKRQSGGLFQDIEITPAVDFSKIEEVFVITKNQKTAVAVAPEKTPTPVPAKTAKEKK